jgi:glutamate carboxypeptidase
MVSMESPSFDKDLTDKFVRFVATKFEEIGGSVQLMPVEKFGVHLRARFAVSSTPRVLLLGHTDTVWPEGDHSELMEAVPLAPVSLT